MNAGTARIKAVDPSLKVVSGGSRRKKRNRRIADGDGVAIGEICPVCGEETFRFVNGVCFQCYQEGRVKKETDQEIEKRAEKGHVRKELQAGRLSLKDMKAGRY